MHKLILSILFLFYIYPISFAFFPFLSTRLFFAICGSVYTFLLVYTRFRDNIYTIKMQYIYIIVILGLISIVSLISVALNSSNDIEFVIYPISVLIMFLAAVFIHKICEKLGTKINEKNIIILIISAVLLQSIISAVLHFSPDLNSVVKSIIAINDTRLEREEALGNFRIIGFGKTFFDAGVNSGAGLILIAYLVKYYIFEKSSLIYLAGTYFIIFIIGMMMARTTMVGAGLSLLLLSLPRSTSNFSITHRTFKFFFLLILLPLCVIYAINTFYPSLFSDIEMLIRFAFEIYFSVTETGSAKISSLEGLMNMYILPDTFKTWVIGDALWLGVEGEGLFYKGIDVGHLRLLYYFGISGWFLYMVYQYQIIKSALIYKLGILIFFLYLLIVNTKGFVDLTPFMALLLLSKIYSKYSYPISN